MEIILWGIFIITTMIFAKFVLMNKNSHKFSDLELFKTGAKSLFIIMIYF